MSIQSLKGTPTEDWFIPIDAGTLGVPGAARPQGAVPKADDERVIADRFVVRNARKTWIYVPTSRIHGEWKEFKDGVWQPGYSLNWSVSQACSAVSQAMHTSASATRGQLRRAKYLASAVEQNVTQLLKWQLSRPRRHHSQDKGRF